MSTNLKKSTPNECMRREFVATGYVVKDKRVLLIDHPKLGLWLPVGGHIEEDELPDEACIREIKEETGLDVTIVTETYGDCENEKVRVLARPCIVQLEEVGDHEHIDIKYVCKVAGGEFKLEDKIKRAQWFSEEELDGFKELTNNVKYFSKRALRIAAEE